VIDGEWSTIGSYNLDSRSLRYNLEVVAEIIDPELGHQMLAQFESDAARCEALSFEQWRNRGRFRRLLGWFFYQLRKWL
jgi:cardiolipin synthase